MAVGGATFGMATISGPLIGGSLTQRVSWRWCFYLNLPIGGAVALTLIALFHPPIRPSEQRPILERIKKLDLIGAFLFILTGIILSSVANGMYSTFKVDTGHAAWIGYQVLNGIGIGFTMETPLTAVQTVLKPEEAPVGISLVTFFQFFGSSIFLAIAQSVFSNRLVSQLAEYAPGLDANSFLQQGTVALRTIVPPAELPGVLIAYNRAFTSTFYVAASALAAGFFAALLSE